MPSLTRLLTLVTPHPQGRQIEASQVFSSEETRFYSDLSNEAALPQSRHLNGKLGTTGDLWPAFLCVEAGTSSCPSVGPRPCPVPACPTPVASSAACRGPVFCPSGAGYSQLQAKPAQNGSHWASMAETEPKASSPGGRGHPGLGPSEEEEEEGLLQP